MCEDDNGDITCLMTTLYYAFADCYMLWYVTLPDSLTYLGQDAFDDKVKLGPPTHPLLVENKHLQHLRVVHLARRRKLLSARIQKFLTS